MYVVRRMSYVVRGYIDFRQLRILDDLSVFEVFVIRIL